MSWTKLDGSLFADARFLDLPLTTQAVFLRLLGSFTLRSRIPGVVPHGAAAVAHQCGLSVRQGRRHLDALERAGLVKSDRTRALTWVKFVLETNLPMNPKMVLGWRDTWAHIPDCPLKDEIREELTASVGKRYPREIAAVFAESGPPEAGYRIHQVDLGFRDTSPIPSPEESGTKPASQEPRERERENKGPKKEEAAKPDTAPEMKEAARRVVKHYQATVKPQTPPGGGDLAALAVLEGGETEERLRASADRYAAWCSRHDKAAQFREAAKTFFSATGQCGAFLDGDPEAPKPVEYHRAAPRPPRDPNAQPVLLRDIEAQRKAAAEAAKAAADKPDPQSPQDAPPAPSQPEARLDRRSCQDGATAQQHGAGVGQAGRQQERQQGGPRPIGAVLERAAQVAG